MEISVCTDSLVLINCCALYASYFNLNQLSMSLLRQSVFGKPPSGLSRRDVQLNCGFLHSCKPNPPSPSLELQPPVIKTHFSPNLDCTCDLSMRNLVLVKVILLPVLLRRPIMPPLLCLTRLTKAFFRRSCLSFSSSILLSSFLWLSIFL